MLTTCYWFDSLIWEDRENREGPGQLTWWIGGARIILSVLKWQEIERNEDPWQLTFYYEEDGTKSDIYQLLLISDSVYNVHQLFVSRFIWSMIQEAELELELIKA